MSKSKSQRKPPAKSIKSVKENNLSETLPAGHRFDEEIAATCSSILIKVQFKRIEQPIHIERSIRQELRAVVARKQLSRVSIDFFQNILNICDKHPFMDAAKQLLSATYQEYCEVRKRMKLLEHKTMLERFESLYSELGQLGWNINLSFENGGTMPLEPFYFFAVHQKWEEKFDNSGRLVQSVSVAVRTDAMTDLTEMAFKHGLLLHRVSFKDHYFHLRIHPDNNIPGIPLSPPSIQIDY